MNRRTATRIAWVSAAATLMISAGGGVILFAVGDSPPSDLVAFAPAFILPVVGALIASRHPGNAIGWLCLAIGFAFSLLNVQGVGARWAFDRGDESLAAWIAVPAWWIPAVGLMATHLALRLPTGSLPSPRWRWFGTLCTATLCATFVAGSLQEQGSGVDFTDLSNPLASGWTSSLGFLYVLLPVCVLGSVASLVIRYRRSTGVERAQLRWIALGACAAIAMFIGGSSLNWAGLYLAAFAAIPIAIGIAMLRHKLYDIDVVVNRALVYGALTAILAGTYLATVLLLQLALGGLTSDSNLAIAGSTLAVAAAFRPVRARIQAAVDRRFYRRRYDARRTLEEFSSRLRDQVDLAALDAELRGVVAETMQPAHVSVWLRTPTAQG